MDLIETLRSTGAVRDFLPEPVDDAVLHRLLDTARFAPSGGNRQGWRVIVVKDPHRRRQLRDLYLADWYKYLALASAGLVPWAPLSDREAAAAALAAADRDLPRYTFAGGASIYPFVWSLLLAARAEGLAGVMTTIAVRREDDVRALFDVPETCAVAALVVMGRPVTAARRLRRRPVENFAWVDRYQGPPLPGG